MLIIKHGPKFFPAVRNFAPHCVFISLVQNVDSRRLREARS